MLSLIEKLINEHGSSKILKDRLLILKDEYESLEKERDGLKVVNAELERQLQTAKQEADRFKMELQSIRSGVLATYVCDHCGSPSLKRTGNRDDPTFGVLGIKQKVFLCNECGKESAFTPEST